MNLAEHLLYKDITELNRLAKVYECSCNHHSKMELIQSIHHTIFSKAQSEAKLNRLSDVEIWICTFIFLQDKTRWYHEDLMALISKVCRAIGSNLSSEQVMQNIMELGWIHLKKENHTSLYIIPEDVHIHIQNCIGGYWLKKGITPVTLPQAEQNHTYMLNEGDAIFRDCLTFLKYLYEHPRQLTAEGSMHKRDQTKLFQLMLVQEKPLPKVQWRFGFGRRYPVYPTRFALIYDFCYEQGYIEEIPDGFVCLSVKGEALLSKETNERIALLRKQLYRFWLKSYRKAIPSIGYILSFINRLSLNHWISINQLFALLKQWIEDYYYEQAEALWEEKLIKMACHLGLYELADYNGERYIRRLKQWT